MRRALRRVAARAKARIPEEALRPLLVARSLAGDGPAIGLPGFRRALVLAPHPDDETIVCGGTIALLSDAGAAVTVAVVSDGTATAGADAPPAEVARRRETEAREAAALLGATEVRWLGLPDGAVAAHVGALAERVTALVAELDPEVVLLPWFGDAHRDHRAVNDALADAELHAGLVVWGGEVWTPLPANRLVDVTAAVERKRGALAVHRTADQAFDLDAMLGLDRYRSVHGLLGRGYAEAFLAAPAPDYAAAVRSTAPDTAPHPGVSGGAVRGDGRTR